MHGTIFARFLVHHMPHSNQRCLSGCKIINWNIALFSIAKQLIHIRATYNSTSRKSFGSKDKGAVSRRSWDVFSQTSWTVHSKTWPFVNSRCFCKAYTHAASSPTGRSGRAIILQLNEYKQWPKNIRDWN